jgi:hypothetical protein
MAFHRGLASIFYLGKRGLSVQKPLYKVVRYLGISEFMSRLKIDVEVCT